ncbi:hypothetical protein INS49_005492 [Diaporthe citri]|uniref:uncharacterized protein n=1 Tax=Diaporthe citri TaxID=83186 RepID=UPI001C81E5DD|nr:uncharacterized protein INS49_005492 [Diaporthe citri]KAG6353530.1 hypothetical protein INS49_005492 [Diaporthe citri]
MSVHGFMGTVFSVSLTKFRFSATSLVISAAGIVFSAASLGLPIKAFPPHSLNLSLYPAFLFPNGSLSCHFIFDGSPGHIIVMLALDFPFACVRVSSVLFLPQALINFTVYLVLELLIFSFSPLSILDYAPSHLVPALFSNSPLLFNSPHLFNSPLLFPPLLFSILLFSPLQFSAPLFSPPYLFHSPLLFKHYLPISPLNLFPFLL